MNPYPPSGPPGALVLYVVVVLATLVVAKIASPSPASRLCERSGDLVLASAGTEGSCADAIRRAPRLRFDARLVALAAGLAWCHERASRRECAVAIVRDRGYRVEHLADGDAYHVRVDEVPPQTVAIAHTHVRVDGLAGCSDVDHEAADEIAPVPLYVQHRRGEIEVCGRR